jgi:hypothetical protein
MLSNGKELKEQNGEGFQLLIPGSGNNSYIFMITGPELPGIILEGYGVMDELF